MLTNTPTTTSADRWRQRRALGLWVILAVAVCIKPFAQGTEHSVYPVFAGAARHWWADMSLYAEYFGTEKTDGYRYSPTFAVAFTPFEMLPEAVGNTAWNLLGVGLLLFSLYVLVRDVLPLPDGASVMTFRARFFALVLAGSILGIWSGQSNAIVPALVALGLAAVAREKWWSAAWLLAVPVFIKIWPLAIVMLLAACWPRQLTWRFATVCLLLALIPFLTRSPETVAWQYHEWYASLTGPLHETRCHGYRDAWTVWESVAPWFHRTADWSLPGARRVYMAVQLATALGVLAWCLGRKRACLSGAPNPPPASIDESAISPGRRRLLTGIFSIWAAWQLIFGPGTEQLTYGIIAAPVAWAVLVSFAEHRARCLMVGVWALLVFLPAGDVEQAMLLVFPAGKMLLPLSVVPFVAWLVWHGRRARCAEARVSSTTAS